MLISTICKKCGSQFQQLDGFNNTLCLECLFPKVNTSKSNPMEIIIKPELIDTSKLDNDNTIKEYRPNSWNEYIGQELAKSKVKTYIDGCKKFNEIYPHTFISASSGMGKTLFASILSNQLNKKIVITTGGELKNEQIFIDKIVESESGLIFIDEANRLPKRVGFFILPLMEQFSIGNKNIKPFTLIFATTHIGDISKDLDALIQRCDKITFEPYTNEELLNIVEQYRKKQYDTIKIPSAIMLEIVQSCRNTPRIAKNLIRSFAYNSNWELIKKYNNIIKDGINNLDIKVLRYLQSTKGSGINSIASYLRVKSQTYLYDIEPYLIFKNFISIDNKRKITNEGIEFLKGIE